MQNLTVIWRLGMAELKKENEMKIRVKKLDERAVVPQRATEGSAGADLYACIDEPVLINPGEIKIIKTGIAIEIPDKNYAAFVYARSGLGIKHGICLANGVGVIDSDYRGEICVGLCNISQKPYTVEMGERVAQMVIMPVDGAEYEEVSDINSTERGQGGFGSTGKF